MLLFNSFKKVSKPASRAFKEFMNVLREFGAFSSNVFDVEKEVNGKRFVSDLSENSKKKKSTHILIFHKNLALCLDLNVILGVKNPKES